MSSVASEKDNNVDAMLPFFAGFMDLNIFAVAAVAIFMVRAEPLLKVRIIPIHYNCYFLLLRLVCADSKAEATYILKVLL